MDDTDRPMVVARFATPLEANLAASKLDACGLPVEVEPHEAFDMLPHLQLAVQRRGIGVMVRAGRAEEARGILASEHRRLGWGEVAEDTLAAEARKILLFSMLALFLVFFLCPVALVRLWQFRRKLRAKAEELAPDDRRRVRWYMATALVVSGLGTVLLALLAAALIQGSVTAWPADGQPINKGDRTMPVRRTIP